MTVVAAAVARRVTMVAAMLLLGACAPPDLTPRGTADAARRAPTGREATSRSTAAAPDRERRCRPPGW
jgi:hypothetical protein